VNFEQTKEAFNFFFRYLQIEKLYETKKNVFNKTQKFYYIVLKYGKNFSDSSKLLAFTFLSLPILHSSIFLWAYKNATLICILHTQPFEHTRIYPSHSLSLSLSHTQLSLSDTHTQTHTRTLYIIYAISHTPTNTHTLYHPRNLSHKRNCKHLGGEQWLVSILLFWHLNV